jgi:hypothetical protein
MQSIHEILAGLMPDDYPELTTFVDQAKRRLQGPAEVIVLDDATRNRAMVRRREREKAACHLEFGAAC